MCFFAQLDVTSQAYYNLNNINMNNYKTQVIEFTNRWLCSTNHKDIGSLYIFFAGFAGIIGTLFSVFIRLELMYPGNQIMGANYQFYNVVITSHALIMIFFLVMPLLIGG